VWIRVATRFRERLIGLSWSRLPRARAMLIPDCRSVHTAGMRFALDLVWLDRDGRVLRVDLGVAPWRVRSCRGAAAVLEVPSPASRPGA